MSGEWLAAFDGLAGLDPETRRILHRGSRQIAAPQGAVLFGPGQTADHMLLLLEGRVRVQQLSEGGREIVLYRIEAGESCILTTACLLAHRSYAAEGIAETDVRAAAIPRALFDDLIVHSSAFREAVFSAYGQRITDLFMVIEDVAFQRLDIRLAQKLIELARGTDRIAATHQQIAAELGTAREVVSRQLGELQRRGWVEQGRGAIVLRDINGLRGLAGASG